MERQQILHPERERDMVVKGKLVSKTSIKWEGDLFNLLQFPYQFSQIIPHMIQNVDLVEGSWGTNGCVILWSYVNDDRKKCVSKERMDGIDERKKSITFNVIGGDPVKSYKSLKAIADVDANGEDNMVTWTLEYDKENAAVADPTAFMDFLVHFTKDVERSRLLVPN